MIKNFKWGELFASQLRRNIASGIGAAMLNILIGLASYPMYLHFLGYEKYGIWLALCTVLTFAQMGNFGINPAVSKLVAEAHGRNDTVAVRRCLTTAWLAVGVGGGAVFCVVIALRQYIPHLFGVSGPNGQLMSSLLPYVALFSAGVFIVETLNAVLVGLGRMDLESYFRIFSQAVALICSAVLLAKGHGVAGVLLGNAIAYVAMLVLSVVATRRILRSRLLTLSSCNFSELSKMLRFGGWVFGAAVMNMAMSPFNRVVLSRYVGIGALPIYEIAYGSAMKVRSLLESGLRAMMPEISRIGIPLTQDTLRRVVALQGSGLRLISRLGAPLYAAVILLATQLLQIWLRNQFQAALPLAFRIMLLGSFLSLIGVPGYYILMGLGRARTCFFTAVIQGGFSMISVGFVVLLTGAISVADVALGALVGMGLSSAFVLWRIARLTPAYNPPRIPASGGGVPFQALPEPVVRVEN